VWEKMFKKTIGILLFAILLIFGCSKQKSDNSTASSLTEEQINEIIELFLSDMYEQEKDDDDDLFDVLSFMRKLDNAKNNRDIIAQEVQSLRADNILLSITNTKKNFPWHLVMTDSYLYKYDLTDHPNYSQRDNVDSGKYNIILENIEKISYINFNHRGYILNNYNSKGQARFLFLYLDNFLFILYDENNELVMAPLEGEKLGKEIYSIATATSELKEGNKTYSTKNLTKQIEVPTFLNPWAAKGGIGEKITIKSEFSRVNYINYIIIANGFINYNRPYLYEYNNRLKKIRVSRKDMDIYVDFEVNDTPNLQIFDLSP